MALNVTLKNSDNPLLDLGKAADQGELAQALIDAGYKMVLQPKSASIVGVSGHPIATIQVNTDAFNMLLQGKLAPTSAHTIMAKVEQLLKEASNGAVGVATYPQKKATKKAAPTIPDGYEDDANEVPVTSSKSSGGISSAPKVKLIEATELHQRVHASSAGSTYFVIALGDDVNVAARLKLSGSGWGISIRIEGPQLKKYATQIAAAGMSFNGDYASHHISGDGGEVMMVRCVGAYLMGLNIGFKQVSTKVAPLTNKGS